MVQIICQYITIQMGTSSVSSLTPVLCKELTFRDLVLHLTSMVSKRKEPLQSVIIQMRQWRKNDISGFLLGTRSRIYRIVNEDIIFRKCLLYFDGSNFLRILDVVFLKTMDESPVSNTIWDDIIFSHHV